MKKILLVLMLFFCKVTLQAQEVKQLFDNAKIFMKQGDYANATILLNQARALSPNDKLVLNELALSYYFQGNFDKAISVITPLLDANQADDQTYQIAATIYKAQKEPMKAIGLYTQAIKAFPESGTLYNGLGELMWELKENTAIDQWELGIEKDPSFSKNYYNAAKYYAQSNNTTWSLLYSEIFLNMEPFSTKSPEIKDLLLENYKKLLANTDEIKKAAKFETSFIQVFTKALPAVGSGINPETLTMLRTRFILDWFNETKRPAFKLFELHRQLLQEGLFDAYNQWIFGPAQNLAYFQNWISANPEPYAAFTNFQKNRIFKIEPGEYYKK